MTRKDRSVIVAQARSALIVAVRRSLLTYGELGRAIGLGGIALSHEMRHDLDDVSDHCQTAGEPSLAALVVNADSGAPGQGWTNGIRPWHAEVQAAFRAWS